MNRFITKTTNNYLQSDAVKYVYYFREGLHNGWADLWMQLFKWTAVHPNFFSDIMLLWFWLFEFGILRKDAVFLSFWMSQGSSPDRTRYFLSVCFVLPYFFRELRGRMAKSTDFRLWVEMSSDQYPWSVLIDLIRKLVCRLARVLRLLVFGTGVNKIKLKTWQDK